MFFGKCIVQICGIITADMLHRFAVHATTVLFFLLWGLHRWTSTLGVNVSLKPPWLIGSYHVGPRVVFWSPRIGCKGVQLINRSRFIKLQYMFFKIQLLTFWKFRNVQTFQSSASDLCLTSSWEFTQLCPQPTSGALTVAQWSNVFQRSGKECEEIKVDTL